MLKSLARIGFNRSSTPIVRPLIKIAKRKHNNSAGNAKPYLSVYVSKETLAGIGVRPGDKVDILYDPETRQGKLVPVSKECDGWSLQTNKEMRGAFFTFVLQEEMSLMFLGRKAELESKLENGELLFRIIV